MQIKTIILSIYLHLTVLTLAISPSMDCSMVNGKMMCHRKSGAENVGSSSSFHLHPYPGYLPQPSPGAHTYPGLKPPTGAHPLPSDGTNPFGFKGDPFSDDAFKVGSSKGGTFKGARGSP